MNIPSYKEIEENSVWVIKFDSGYRATGTYDEIQKLAKNSPDVDEYDTVSWMRQPEELKPFYKAYEYALFRLNRTDLYLLKDFYDEWSKDPSKFEPAKREPIGQLSDIIADFNECSDLIINNYDGETAGNHHVGNFIDALEALNTDFDVVEMIREDGKTPRIIIQEEDYEKFHSFDVEANEQAIRHDKYFGDGKYWREDPGEEEDRDI